MPKGYFGTMNLGELLVELHKQPEENIVYFDFASLIPRGLDSYRGFYDHLAFSFDCDESKDVTVADVIKMLEEAKGRPFQGYKGGSFVMDADTPVWVSNNGKADSIQIVGVERLSDSRWTYIKIRRENED